MKQRLTRKDWALISEALEMLSMDYDDNHPNQAQINALSDLATQRGDFEKPERKCSHDWTGAGPYTMCRKCKKERWG